MAQSIILHVAKRRKERKKLPKNSLAERLWRARDSRGLEQQEAADDIGVTRRTYISYERGDTEPTSPIIRRRLEEWLAG